MEITNGQPLQNISQNSAQAKRDVLLLSAKSLTSWAKSKQHKGIAESLHSLQAVLD
jgi:hypothetical protein